MHLGGLRLTHQRFSISKKIFCPQEDAVSNEEQLDGFVDFTLRIVTTGSNFNVAGKYLKLMEGVSEDARFLLLEEAGILVPLAGEEALTAIESELTEWLKPGLRGVAYSSKEVLKKLKRLGFREKSTVGSHVHLESESGHGKVTIPVHGGTLKKGTLKSILRQSGIDLSTLAYA